MSAQEIVKALEGRWHGSYGMARCPGHDDHDPSLSVSEAQDGTLLVKCHAGCDQGAVWAALQSEPPVLKEPPEREKAMVKPFEMGI